MSIPIPNKDFENWGEAFRDLETEICDLVRLADLAVYLHFREACEGEKIAEDGTSAAIVLETLRDRMLGLKHDYRRAFEGVANATPPAPRLPPAPQLSLVTIDSGY